MGRNDRPAIACLMAGTATASVGSEVLEELPKSTTDTEFWCVKFTILTNYTEVSSTLQPILTIWPGHLMPHLTFTLFLLQEHPTSIKTTIEFFDELLTIRCT
jgi:hypothetical protein